MEETLTAQPKKKKLNFLPILMCWIAYTSAYIGRFSYASNIISIEKLYGVLHADAGLVSTFFFFAYGAGQIINGIFNKKYNKKYVMSGALIISSIINFLFFLQIPFELLKYLWLINGIAQSVLWPCLISLLSDTLKKEDLPSALVVLSSTVALGTFLAYGASALFTLFGVFQLSFLFGTISMSIVAVIWILNYNRAFVKNVEREVVEEPTTQTQNKTSKGILTKSLLTLIIVLCLCAIIDNLVKDGLNTWVPSILKEKFKLDDSLSIILTLVLPVLGFFGGSCNPYLEKKLKSFVPLLGFWFLLTAIFTVIVILFLDLSWIVVLLSFGLISLFTHGANGVITGMAPLYMRDKIGNSGMLAGVLNGCCYVGSTISSYGLGVIADNFDWSGVFALLLAVSCVPVVVTGVMTIVKMIKGKKNAKNS